MQRFQANLGIINLAKSKSCPVQSGVGVVCDGLAIRSELLTFCNLKNTYMLQLEQTETFRKWRTELKDRRARALIASRLDRLAFGPAGFAVMIKAHRQRTSA
ncbi:hypothetical protein [Phyllobacterium sp. 1468]|uniref:hypothetical protein n=1 Tax=Phyllobacterium sp. 1468 TaxID=2817759 RepID=UPI00286A75AC|nr:hypothetical protein [Phyllobacterium sp. 1468]